MDIETLYRAFLACSCVSTDSRHTPPGSLFIALRGANFDGNAYAAAALRQGSRMAVIDNPDYLPTDDTRSRYLLTDNCLRTLQELARHHRRQLHTPIVAITGTNGKTTTKELTAAVLSRHLRTLYTEGNLNNHIGVPLTLLRLRPEHQVAVVEMGASHPGDIRELVEIAEPDCGLITNIGRAHLQGFGSLEGVARTKGELYDYLRDSRKETLLFVHADSDRLMQMSAGQRRLTYGTQGDICGEAIAGDSPALSLRYRLHPDDEWQRIETRLIGDYNLPNALAAIAVGTHFGVDTHDIHAALADYTPTNGRSQLTRTDRNTLVVDAYNANPTSMRAAIDNFARLQAAHKMLILGDMRELGADSADEHRAIVQLLQGHGLADVVLVGPEFAATQPPYPTYPDVDALSDALTTSPPTGKTILIKGSNGIHLQKIVPLL